MWRSARVRQPTGPAHAVDPGGVQQVSAVCPTPAQQADTSIQAQLPEFAVQVSWSSGQLAGGTGIDLTYDVNGREHTALLPFGIWLCASACPDNFASGATPS